jgi:hypothetical protein
MLLKHIKILSRLFVLVLLSAVYSCTDNTVSPAVLPLNCDTTDLSYTNSMQTIIDINCGSNNTGCHSAGTERDFSNYSSLKRYAIGGQTSRFWQEIFVLKKMPEFPGLPLDLCTSNQFKAWLLDGAPQ